MDILKHKAKVFELLSKCPHLRDDDNKLVANVWYSQLESKSDMTAFQFLEGYAKGKFANSDSVTRMRRKLQEEFPELRGKKWAKRHGKLQEDVKEQLYETPELYKGGTP